MALPFLCAFLATIVTSEFILAGVKTVDKVHISRNKKSPIEGAKGVSA